MTPPSDLLLALHPVQAELRRLGVRHYIGGSVASSFHGASRSTVDVDIVAELDARSASLLVDALQGEYYASKPAALDAVRRRSCFNLIHLATAFKVDIFVSKGRPHDLEAFGRVVRDHLLPNDSQLSDIASVEDAIIAKLEWYRLGGEVSERQWADITTMARLKCSELDRVYLVHAAKSVGVDDLLDRLRRELDF